MTINILLVEDQKLIRVGLKSLFDGQEEMQVTLEAETGKEAVEKHYNQKQLHDAECGRKRKYP